MGEKKHPAMMTIREVAKTGVLSEYALRILAKKGKIPCISINNKVLINYDALIEQLNNLKGA